MRAAGAGRFQSEALVLRRFPYGESSLVVHALTPERGRVALLAKGAYRLTSGFFAVFDLFDTLEVGWSARSTEELGLVSRAALRVRRASLAGDLERYEIGLGLLERAHLTSRPGHEERELFRWLTGALDLLQGESAVPAVVAAAADLALLLQNGLAPALTGCASCGRAGDGTRDVPVSLSQGGRLCARCVAAGRSQQSIERFPAGVLRVAESLMRATPAMLEHTRVEARLLQRVRVFARRFLEYHLDARLHPGRLIAPTPP